MQYPILIHQTKTGYSASVPDLPGCVGVGETRDEILELMAEAIQIHVDGLREDGEYVPEPSDIALVGR